MPVRRPAAPRAPEGRTIPRTRVHGSWRSTGQTAPAWAFPPRPGERPWSGPVRRGRVSCHHTSPSIATGKETWRYWPATSAAVIGEGQVPHGRGRAAVLSVMPTCPPRPGWPREIPICRGVRVPSFVDMNTVRTYEIRTYGCQMNFHDSERLTGLLEESGYRRADQGAVADVVVFNTCAVRENADNRLYGNLGHLLPVKSSHPGHADRCGRLPGAEGPGRDRRAGPVGGRRIRHAQHRIAPCAAGTSPGAG